MRTNQAFLLAKQRDERYTASPMLNYIWLGLILLATLFGGFTGRMKEVTEGAIKGAENAVTLVIGLIGIMTLWLGIMRLAEKSGFVQVIARALRPLLRWLFPDVPPDHPAMGSMVLNMAANMLGLINAATPLGLRAMKDLEKLNPRPGTATNAMCTFLAINTSSIQLLPITAVGILAAAGSKNPTAIIGTAFIATIFSTLAGIISVKALEKLPMFRLRPPTAEELAAKKAETIEEPDVVAQPTLAPMTSLQRLCLFAYIICFVFLFYLTAFPEALPYFNLKPTAEQLTQSSIVRSVNALSLLAIPFLLSFFPLYAALRRLKVYEEFVEGAKEGFNVAIKIIPYLVTILVAITMFRGGGGIEWITKKSEPFLKLIGFPPELLPLSLMRPLSGSGSLGLFTDIVKGLGPDNIISRMAATLYGSTETTFYVITVYFGSIAVRRTRHAIAAGLIADGVGVIASIIVCNIVFR